MKSDYDKCSVTSVLLEILNISICCQVNATSEVKIANPRAT